MIMVIIVVWSMWVIWIMDQTYKMLYRFEIKSISMQMARDGIEWFMNLRDTNWKTFSVDYKNCWNTFDYNDACIWDDNNLNWTDIQPWDYAIYQDMYDNLDSYSDAIKTYRRRLIPIPDSMDPTSDYDVRDMWIDDDWFFTQVEDSYNTYFYNNTFKTKYDWFERILTISYLNSSWVEQDNTDLPYMKVKVTINRNLEEVLSYEVVLSNWMEKHAEL